LLVAALAAGLAWRSRRREASEPPACARCGKSLQPGESGECAACREAVLLDDLKRRPVAPPGSGIEAFMDTGVFPQMSLEERLEKTFVMQEVPVLEVREPGEPPRSFQLSPEHAFSIGRSPQRASLAIPDPTLSAEHFRVVPHGDGFYLLDLGSTNGTLRAGERLRAARLHVGDLLHAGRAEFVFTMKQLARNGARRSVAAGA
jgi:FHA domain-containing protein